MPTLDWVNKSQALEATRAVPIHLLKQEAAFGDADARDNLLIQGDNLLALKALLPVYAGRVKCIFIDPPYNTQSAFEHYDDKLEHSQWLSMMLPRLTLLRELLAEDGSLWVTIDDNEAHYLKVLMDQVFGRGNFVASNIWQKRYSRENREAIGDVHDYILVYVRDPGRFKQTRNRIPLDEKQAKIYRNPDNPKETDPSKRRRGLPMTAQGFRPNQMYEIVGPNGTRHRPPEGRCWSMIESEFEKLRAANRIYWGKDGNAQPSVIRYLSEVEGLVPWTWWPHEEVGHTDEAKKEANVLFGGDISFGTPKGKAVVQTPEAKRADWEQRKRRYLSHLAEAADDTLLVSGCDKLHNARAIVADMRVPAVGAKVFERFTGRRDGTLWYYREIANVFTGRGVPVAGELQSVVEAMGHHPG